MENSSRFQIAEGLIEISGAEPEDAKKIFKLAIGRAAYIRHREAIGKPVEPYEGEYPGIIAVASRSILLEQSFTRKY